MIPLYIDITTGEARVSLDGPLRQRLKFFLNDLTPLRVAFVQNGVNITDTLLESGDAQLKVGIRAKPGQGTILAEAVSYSIVSSEAQVILPMNEGAMTAYFDDENNVPLTQNEATLFLEIQVQNQAGTTRCTYYQEPCIVAREVIEAGESPPPPPPP